MRVVSIDVGIIHLAIVAFHSEDEFLVLDEFHLVDITVLRHTRVSRRDCTLCHGNSLVDRIDHFVQEHAYLLDDADKVLIEQQPPGGHQAVEQLLYKRFRDRAALVSPTSMHAFYKIRSLAYDERKQWVEQYTDTMLTYSQRTRLESYERRHDVCDAICMAHFWWTRQKLQRPRERVEYDPRKDPFSFIEQFAFNRCPSENSDETKEVESSFLAPAPVSSST